MAGHEGQPTHGVGLASTRARGTTAGAGTELRASSEEVLHSSFDDDAKLSTSSVPILSVTCTTTAPFFIYGLLGLHLVSSPLLA